MRGSTAFSVVLVLIVCGWTFSPATAMSLNLREALSRSKRMSFIVDADAACRERAMPCIFALDAMMMPNSATAEQACRSLQGFYECVATAITECADASVTSHWHQMGDTLNCNSN